MTFTESLLITVLIVMGCHVYALDRRARWARRNRHQDGE